MERSFPLKQTQEKITERLFAKETDLSVIIPVYNEEQNILELYKQLKRVLRNTGKSHEVIFVDDGSKDQTLDILAEINQENKEVVKVISFARNFGHQIALTAGFNYCSGRAAIVMDADLQDPVEVLAEFIQKWEEGYDIVYGVRKVREGESFFKKFTAKLFYRLIRKITAIDIPENVGDFYLSDRSDGGVLAVLRFPSKKLDEVFKDAEKMDTRA